MSVAAAAAAAAAAAGTAVAAALMAESLQAETVQGVDCAIQHDVIACYLGAQIRQGGEDQGTYFKHPVVSSKLQADSLLINV